MSSPVSPSAMFSMSPKSPAPFTTTDHPETLPAFPIEVQKRILHFALNLEPRYTFTLEKEPKAPLTGLVARQNDTRRVVERLNTHRSALNLMRVCKAWKKEATEYLYAEPHITPSNLFLFAHALKNGDKKWSDLHLHPVSVPGRYVTLLDLTHLCGYQTPHPTALHRVIREIFPLIANLQHLRLPNIPIPLAEIRRAPFARRLKVIEGLQVVYDEIDPVLKLLQSLPNLEILSLTGPGNVDTEMFDGSAELNLPKLHTLILNSVKSGQVLQSLIMSDLPQLRNLHLTSYAGCVGDLTVSYQQSHPDVTDLTYLQPCEWPGFRSLPSLETIEMYPNLERLSYLISKDLGHLAEILDSPHSLKQLRIPKWTTPIQREGAGSTALLDQIIQNPGRLERIIVDGFRWVRADLGMRALQTGDAGEMRRWSEKLKVVGIDLVDMDGKVAMSTANVGYIEKGRRRSGVRYVSDKLDEDGG